MTHPALLSPAAMQIVDWLGEVGPRWGLPADACRVHACLFLIDRPAAEPEIGEALRLTSDRTREALDWLRSQGQAERQVGGWRTGTDPWLLMLKSLETRRAQELAAARPVIDRWQREGGTDNTVVRRQAGQLFALVEDIAAIDAGSRFISATTARRLIGLGGRTARFLDRTIGTRTKR
ncbi:hypothetical protein FPZ24_07965 [Sphingomonas panacisoli]|uniref:HTH marR-type domain-containing protein n=1 Tax=Sphingomonas panacisoli TaxID=1813879 RepID=A0A5B8LH63_9SPHN|nr:hypothetical protein [Sphingomonas panacisoli]QDZ07423.1 hypothetical protein FPZ24_07965 [Sphingomonas panacisoli]